MNWKTIRLELARTSDFPSGSVSRAYLLRVPLDEDGGIDEQALDLGLARATVRRFWPSQPDRSGHLVRENGSWSFRCNGDAGGSAKLGEQPFRLGSEVTVTEADGSSLPFRVASIRTA